MKNLFITAFLCWAISVGCRAQGFIEMGYTPKRNFTDTDGKNKQTYQKALKTK